MLTETNIFQNELQPNEGILWTCKPRQGIMFRAMDIFLVPFSLLWAGFAFVWESVAVLGGAPIFFMLWGIPFVLVGLYMIFGRFLVDAWNRSKTYYALTTERALIVSGLVHCSTRLISLRTVSEIGLSVKGNGRGTISFGSLGPFAWWSGTNAFGSNRYGPPGFEQIENARNVYSMVQRAQSGLK